MMKILQIAILFLILFFGRFAAMAQTTEFTFQGKLNNNSSEATGNFDFEFRLFGVNSGGTALATQQKLNVAVTNGIFTVNLDFGAVNFDGSNRWLEIAVRQTGGGDAFTTLSPRPALTSAPYSIKSLKSFDTENLGGTAASQFVQTIAPRLSDARNPLAGSANYIQNTTTQQSADFNISGSGIIDGSLGIGTTTAPRAPLEVNGNAVQDISANGFVKAMAFVTVTQTPQGQFVANITRCFNGVLNSSTGGCGFTATVTDFSPSLRIRVNFGFTVDNRFISFNELDDPGNTALNTVAGRISFFDSNTVQTVIARNNGKVFIFVY